MTGLANTGSSAVPAILLDKEVLALLERAKPLPSPTALPGANIKLIVPVQFFLR